MITYQELESTMAANLDAEGSQRYLPEQDYIPAINSAVSRAMTAIGYVMANRDGSEEAIRELTYTRIFQTNSEGGVAISDPALESPLALGHGIWNVLAVYARPEVIPSTATPSAQQDQVSLYRSDVAFSGSGDPVERVTLEEIAVLRNNAFMSGNEVLASNPKRVTFSYYIVGNAGSTGYDSGIGEVRVLPKSVTSKSFVGISYLANPVELTPANYTTVQIPFPQSMKRTLADWALQYIAWKQGDGTNLQANAQRDAQELFQLATN